jgi:phospholipid transport system substrate-binding protein
MDRWLDRLERVVQQSWFIGVVDSLLLCLGLTWTLASLVPGLRSALAPAGRETVTELQGREELPMRCLTLAIAMGLTLILPATTAVAATSPAEQLRGQIQRVVRTLEDPELRKDARTADRRAAIRALAAEMFDVAEMAKRSLGTHWGPRTPAEREEMVRLFGGLLERSYVMKVEAYSGERISVVSEAVDGDLAVVRTRITTRQGTDIPVDYRMHQRGERWAIYDVAIEGVSLVGNYRGQFNKILQSGSFPELVKRLRAKLDGQSAEAVPGRSRGSVQK